MRVSTLSAVCATALILPISAAPLATSTAFEAVPVFSQITLELNGPPELANPPLPTLPAMPKVPAGSKDFSTNRLSKSNKLSRLPRADFRQADYGVSHNVTLLQVPVQGVEATPATGSPAALSRRSEDDWEASRLHPDYVSSDAAAPSGDLADAAPDASYPSESAPASAAPPLAVGDVSKANTNRIPVHPNMASVSNLAGGGVHALGESRFKTSYAAHDMLANLQPSTAQSTGGLPGGLLRRVVQHTRDFATPVKRVFDLAKNIPKEFHSDRLMKRVFDLAKGFGPHTFGVNSNALLPARPDPSLNMSDPYVAQEEMRRQHEGVLNIDSNRAAPPPAPEGPLNATDAGAALKEQAGGAKNSTTLPIADHQKSAKSVVENAKKGTWKP
ncbi:hypothetical protein VTO73DRAFT_5101 [Trametes versicolor]